MRGHFTKRVLAVVVIVAILSVGIPLLYNFHEAAYPRQLEVGDTWNYAVVFPDSHEYMLTETVQTRLPNDTYLILRDDAQHLSTGYVWLTSSWYEIGESTVVFNCLKIPICESSRIFNPVFLIKTVSIGSSCLEMLDSC